LTGRRRLAVGEWLTPGLLVRTFPFLVIARILAVRVARHYLTP